MAAQVVDSLNPSTSAPLEGWSTTEERLANIEDLLSLIAKSMAQGDLDLPNARRPVTAIERIKSARLDAKRDGALTQLLGENY